MRSGIKVARVPLFGSIESRDYKSFSDGLTANAAVTYDQGATNAQCDMLIDPMTGARTGYFYPRENFATSGVPASSGAGTAVHVWTGSANEIISAFGDTNSTIYKAGVSQGAITGQAAFITEGMLSGVANLFVTNTVGSKGYYGTGGGSFTNISDAQYPGNNSLTTTGPLVQFDGYTFVMCTNGDIWNSDLNSIANWTAGSNITAQKKPDAGLGVLTYGNAIVAFCRSSVEFFFNAGNASGSPLSAEANFINLGVPSQYAFCNIGNTVAFFSDSNGYGIYILNGRQEEKISTPPIDRILAGSTATSIRLNPFVSWGRLFLLVTAPVAPGQLAYDTVTKLWYFWNFTGNQVTQSDVVPGSGTSSSVYVGPSVTSYFAHSATGLTGTFLTAKWDGGTGNRKFIHRISPIAAMGSTTATNVSISWADNDYETFTTARTVGINASERGALTRCGATTKRAFKVSGANDNNGRILRISALEIEYEEGNI